MALRDPIAVYNAANNAEAQFLAIMLNNAGVEAMAVDDVSYVGVWAFGFLPEINRPKVWVEREAVDRTKPILEEYEQQLADRRAKDRQSSDLSQGPIDVLCEECGEHSEFPAAQNGTTQNCPHCGAYVDVGEQVPIAGWDEPTADDPLDDEG